MIAMFKDGIVLRGNAQANELAWLGRKRLHFYAADIVVAAGVIRVVNDAVSGRKVSRPVNVAEVVERKTSRPNPPSGSPSSAGSSW